MARTGKVKLWCGVYREAILFSVEIDRNADVYALQEAIVAKKKDVNPRFKVDPDTLTLRLARKGTAWLQDDKTVTSLLRGPVDTNYEVMRPSWPLEDVEYFGTDFTPQRKQIHVLVGLPGQASASIRPAESLGGLDPKRRKTEGALDEWMNVLMDEQIDVLPSTRGDLQAHLERELQVKVPIDDALREIALACDYTGKRATLFNKLFEAKPFGKMSPPTYVIVKSVLQPLMPWSQGVTETTYIHLWDSLIAQLLTQVSGGKMSRNTNSSTCTGLHVYRPDLCFYYRNSNICVFRGEEKAGGDMQVPVTELYAKLTWRYDAAPYILGYAAVGLQVCLVAIRKDEATECGAKVEKLETYDLGDLEGRMSFFLALLNLSTLFRPIVDLIEPLGIVDYGITERSNGVKILIAEGCVMKKYPSDMPSDGIIRKLETLHRLMKEHSVPNVVKLRTGEMKKKYVTLAPVGQLFPPQSIHELLTALRDILKALVALHAIKVMHRDLRWDNVLKYTGEADKWFLIDFDEGAMDPAGPATNLNPESHAPEILSSPFHTVKVDIWGVGYLLKTSQMQDLPRELEDMKTKCLGVRPSERPTAESLLEVIESLVGRYI